VGVSGGLFAKFVIKSVNLLCDVDVDLV